jgi:hypothetical protein
MYSSLLANLAFHRNGLGRCFKRQLSLPYTGLLSATNTCACAPVLSQDSAVQVLTRILTNSLLYSWQFVEFVAEIMFWLDRFRVTRRQLITTLSQLLTWRYSKREKGEGLNAFARPRTGKAYRFAPHHRRMGAADIKRITSAPLRPASFRPFLQFTIHVQIYHLVIETK